MKRSSPSCLSSVWISLFLWTSGSSLLGVHSFTPSSLPSSTKTLDSHSSTTTSPASSISSTMLHMSFYDDSAEAASPLSLTAQDIARMKRHQTKTTSPSSTASTQSTTSTSIMPLLIGDDALLPDQQVTLESSDPSLARLLHHALQHSQPVAMVGLHPHTHKALTRGVAVDIHERDLAFGVDHKGRKTVRWTVTGGRTIQLPSSINADYDDDDDNDNDDGDEDLVWMDPSRSFYMAHVEYLDQQPEPHLSPEQDAVVQQLADTIPKAMQQWQEWVTNYHFETTNEDDDDKNKNNSLPSSVPASPRERAFWVAAHLNPPHDATQFCLDIRPAMLACRNDYERTLLACQALQSSTDHLSGKKRMF